MISRMLCGGGMGLLRRFQLSDVRKITVRHIIPHTSSNVVSGPPRNRISFAEKVCTGVFIFAMIWGTPAYIVTHMDCYRTLPSDKEETEEESG